MERTGSDTVEVIKTSASSDALTVALMRMEQSLKVRKEQGVPLAKRSKGSLLERRRFRNKVMKDGAETRHRNKVALTESHNAEDDNMEVAPTFPRGVSKDYNPNSSGNTITTSCSEKSGSDIEKEEKLDQLGKITRSRSNLSRKGSNVMKEFSKMFRSKGQARKTTPEMTESEIQPDAGSILRDLDIQSVGTTTVRVRNTLKKGYTSRRKKEDPTERKGVMKRASRYQKKARKLLQSAKELGMGNKSDPKQIESLARLAYRYATESRRLYDVAEKMERSKSMIDHLGPKKYNLKLSDHSVSELSGLTSKGSIETDAKTNTEKAKAEVIAKDLREVYSASIFDDDESNCTGKTTFSAKVEREEHNRKMKELEFFSKQDFFNPFLDSTCSPQSELSKVYVSEASRIMTSINDPDADLLSVFSDKTNQTTLTTASELKVRLEHQKKMGELELFHAPKMWKSMMDALVSKKAPEKLKGREIVIEENDDDDDSEAESAQTGHTDKAAQKACDPFARIEHHMGLIDDDVFSVSVRDNEDTSHYETDADATDVDDTDNEDDIDDEDDEDDLDDSEYDESEEESEDDESVYTEAYSVYTEANSAYTEANSVYTADTNDTEANESNYGTVGVLKRWITSL